MSEEEKKEASKTVPILPCGHEDSFEHRFVEGMLEVAEIATMVGGNATESCMLYLRKVFEAFYIQIPTNEEMRTISLAHSLSQENKNKEVN